MNKEEFTKLIKELGHQKVQDLYCYSCLLCSHFDEQKAYDLIDVLNSVWLKDENNYSISLLSDKLYELVSNGEDIEDMSARDILDLIYEDIDF